MNNMLHRPLWAATLALGLSLLAGTAHAQTTTPGTTTPGSTSGTTTQPGYPASGTTQTGSPATPGRMGTGDNTSTDRQRANSNGTTPGNTNGSRRDRRSRTNKGSSNSASPSGM